VVALLVRLLAASAGGAPAPMPLVAPDAPLPPPRRSAATAARKGAARHGARATGAARTPSPRTTRPPRGT